MTAALQHLHALVDDADDRALRSEEAWRWQVRRELSAVRDLLRGADHDGRAPSDAWLSARGGAVRRERDVLLRRLGLLGSDVLTSSDVAMVRAEVHRLVTDVDHHLQRRRDLAWDDVELELGGSE